MKAHSMTNATNDTTSDRDLAKTIQTLNSEHFLDEPHSTIFAKTTIVACTLALIAFWIWAMITPVYEVVSGDGMIKPNGFVVPVEHPHGGSVTAIHVAEGQEVQINEIIATLDDQDITAELEKYTTQNRNLHKTIERNQQVLNHNFGKPWQRDFATNANQQRANPHLDYRIAQVDHLRATRNVESAHLDTSRAQHEQLLSEFAILTERYERYQLLFERGQLTRSDLERSEIEVIRIKDDLEELSGKINSQIATIEQSMAKELELIAGFKHEASTNVIEAQALLSELSSTIALLEERLAQTQVRASQNGVIAALAVHHEREVIAPGARIAEIIPRSSGLFAEIEVSANKIGGIKPGADAKLKVLTHDFTRFGHVDATVVSIAPNSYTKEDGTIVYSVRLEFDRDTFARMTDPDHPNDKRSIDPGMTVVADIKIGKKTVLQYLIKPLRAISDRAFTET
jgi:adhesin transport system membrane fusion protein